MSGEMLVSYATIGSDSLCRKSGPHSELGRLQLQVLGIKIFLCRGWCPRCRHGRTRHVPLGVLEQTPRAFLSVDFKMSTMSRMLGRMRNPEVLKGSSIQRTVLSYTWAILFPGGTKMDGSSNLDDSESSTTLSTETLAALKELELRLLNRRKKSG